MLMGVYSRRVEGKKEYTRLLGNNYSDVYYFIQFCNIFEM